jgi:hypothetical protein
LACRSARANPCRGACSSMSSQLRWQPFIDRHGGHWESFCRSFGLEEFLEDPRLKTTTDRIEARPWTLRSSQSGCARSRWRSSRQRSRGSTFPPHRSTVPRSSTTIRTYCGRAGSFLRATSMARSAGPSIPARARRRRAVGLEVVGNRKRRHKPHTAQFCGVR